MEIPRATPSLPKPKAMMPMPPNTIAMMVTILIRANQNSNSPKALTAIRLIEPMLINAASAQIQRGTSGNQIPMYTATAVISATQVTSHRNQ
ncbi:hypothetical protein D3C81_1711960 [compost metagenome]